VDRISKEFLRKIAEFVSERVYQTPHHHYHIYLAKCVNEIKNSWKEITDLKVEKSELKHSRSQHIKKYNEFMVENAKLKEQVEELKKSVHGHKCIHEIASATIKSLTTPDIQTSICADPKDLPS
jgi:uncharacterized protein (UPF0305 family)